jgi:hypothetical protein
MERLPPREILKNRGGRRYQQIARSGEGFLFFRASGKARSGQDPGELFSDVAAAESAEPTDRGGTAPEQPAEGFREMAVTREPELERETREILFDPIERGSQTQLRPVARKG